LETKREVSVSRQERDKDEVVTRNLCTEQSKTIKKCILNSIRADNINKITP